MNVNDLELILERFRTDCNCAHAVMLAFREQTGLDEGTIMGLGLGFGGGIARTGQVCGAVNGAVITLGMVCLKAMKHQPDAKELANRVVQQFLEEFKKANGSVYCGELLDGLDLRSPEGRQAFKQTGLHEKVCEPAVRSAVEAAGKLIGIVTGDS